MAEKLKKGDYDQECNRTACNNQHARFYNHSTLKYYCSSCALEINKWAQDFKQQHRHELCVKQAPNVAEQSPEEIAKDLFVMHLEVMPDSFIQDNNDAAALAKLMTEMTVKFHFDKLPMYTGNLNSEWKLWNDVLTEIRKL